MNQHTITLILKLITDGLALSNAEIFVNQTASESVRSKPVTIYRRTELSGYIVIQLFQTDNGNDSQPHKLFRKHPVDGQNHEIKRTYTRVGDKTTV